VRSGRLATAAVAVTALIVMLVWLFGVQGFAPVPTVTPAPFLSPSAPVGTTPPSPTPPPTAAPTTAVVCTGELVALPSALAADPCPDAIAAVELAVAPVRLPIQRIVIQPGPFYCDVLWPGVGSPRVCAGVMVRPGQFMHAWASFAGSTKVAAVALGLDLPDDVAAPGATRPPWNATLVSVETPPSGWVMP
jgi:hypothetical protein